MTNKVDLNRQLNARAISYYWTCIELEQLKANDELELQHWRQKALELTQKVHDLEHKISKQATEVCKAFLNRRYAKNPSQDLDELFSVAIQAVPVSLTKYDPTLENTAAYTTLLHHEIRSALSRHHREYSAILSHPAWVYELQQQVLKFMLDYQVENGEPPSSDAIMKGMNVSPNRYQAVLYLQVAQTYRHYKSEQQGDDAVYKINERSSIIPSIEKSKLSEEDQIKLAISQRADRGLTSKSRETTTLRGGHSDEALTEAEVEMADFIREKRAILRQAVRLAQDGGSYSQIAKLLGCQRTEVGGYISLIKSEINLD